MNPLLFLFVFTYIMPHMTGGAAMNPTAQHGAAGGGNFGTVLLPGLMAVAIMFSGIAAVALPLAQEFGITREIDDRVMCPLPIEAVAIEKIVFSAHAEHRRRRHRLPARLLHPLHAGARARFKLALPGCGACACQPARGRARPHHRHRRQTQTDRPHLRRGCDAHHVPGLRLLSLGALGPIHWLQIGVLVNPIVYMSEGLRAALTPTLGHMNRGSSCSASAASSLCSHGSVCAAFGIASSANGKLTAQHRILGWLFILASPVMAYFWIWQPLRDARASGDLNYNMKGLLLPPALFYLGVALQFVDLRDGQIRATAPDGRVRYTRKARLFFAGLVLILGGRPRRLVYRSSRVRILDV